MILTHRLTKQFGVSAPRANAVGHKPELNLSESHRLKTICLSFIKNLFEHSAALLLSQHSDFGTQTGHVPAGTQGLRLGRQKLACLRCQPYTHMLQSCLVWLGWVCGVYFPCSFPLLENKHDFTLRQASLRKVHKMDMAGVQLPSATRETVTC
jgi:hypothetical protein